MFEPGTFEESLDLFIFEPEPPVAHAIAHPGLIVLAQIQHEHVAAGPENPRGLDRRVRRVGRMMQRLRQQRNVDAGIGKRQLLDLAAFPRDVRHAAALGLLFAGSIALFGTGLILSNVADAQTTEAIVDVHNLQPLPEAQAAVPMYSAVSTGQFEDLVRPTAVPTVAPTAIPTVGLMLYAAVVAPRSPISSATVETPYTAAASPAGPAPTTTRSKQRSGIFPTVSPR